MPGWIIDNENVQSRYSSESYTVSETLSNIPYGFDNGCAVVLNNEIHILGGETNPLRHYKWDGSSWVSVSILPYSFYDGCAAVLDGKIHIIGGSGENTAQRHYIWDGSSWSASSPLPDAYYAIRSSCVVLNNELHVLGSKMSAFMDCRKMHYKWTGTGWVSVSTLPFNFAGGGCVVLNNEIHILGGEDGGTNHYKWNGSSWSSVSTLPYTIWNGSAVVLNDEIHIFNGLSHSKWNGSSWSSVGTYTLPYDVTFAKTVVNHGFIFLLGADDYYASGHERDFKVYYNSSWTTSYTITIGGTLPYDFHGGNAVLYRGEIHILGGGNHSTSHYKWDGSSWVSVSTLPAPIYDYYNGRYAIVYHDKIHLMTRDYHYVWDGSTWSSLPHHISYENSIAGMVVFEDAIHFLIANEHYRWTEENGIQLVYGTIFWDYAIGRTSMVVYNGDIHIFGSKDNGSTLHMYYSKQYRDWYMGTPCPFDMSVTSVVVFNGLVHAFGSRASGYTRKHVTFDGSYWATLSDIPYDFYQASAVVTADNKVALLGSGDYSSYGDRYWNYADYAPTHKIIDAWTKEVGPVDSPIYEKVCSGTFDYTINGSLYNGKPYYIRFENTYSGGEIWTATIDPVTGEETVDYRMFEAVGRPNIYPRIPDASGYFYETCPNGYVRLKLSGVSGKVRVYIGKTNTTTEPETFVYKMKNAIRAWIGDSQGRAKLILTKRPYALQETDSNPDLFITDSISSTRLYSYIFTYHGNLYGIHQTFNQGEPVSAIYRFDNHQWVSSYIPDLPTQYNEGFLFELNGVLHYMSGRKSDYQGSVIGLKHYIYDEDSAAWVAKNDFPISNTSNIVVGTFKNEIYAVVTVSGNLYRWNEETDSWKELSRSPYRFSDSQTWRGIPYRDSLVEFNNKLYLFWYTAPIGEATALAMRYASYDKYTNTWSREEQVSGYFDTYDSSKNASYRETKIIVVSGYLLILGYGKDVLYDLGLNSWITIDYTEAYLEGVLSGRGDYACATVYNHELHILRKEQTENSNSSSGDGEPTITPDPDPQAGATSDTVIHEKLKLYFSKPSSNNEEEEEIVVVEDGGTVTEEPLGG